MKYSICNVRDFGALGDGSANDAPALQAALDSGAATVYIPAGAYRVGDTLRVHSDTHILCDGRARLFLCEKKPKKRGDFLLTNADPVSGNRNITVTGGIWDGNYDGRNNNKPDDLFAPEAWSGSTLNFVGVTGLTLEDLDMRNSTVYYIRMARLSHFTIRNIRFSAEKAAFNQDGLHFGGHVYDGLIENITASPGQTNDDLIALNADDSMARLENFDLCRGPIEDVVIRGVFAEDCYTAFRMLSVTSPIRRITIENVYVGCRHYAVNIDGARYCRTPLVTEAEYPRGAGLLSDVTIRNMHVWTTMESGADRVRIDPEGRPHRRLPTAHGTGYAPAKAVLSDPQSDGHRCELSDGGGDRDGGAAGQDGYLCEKRFHPVALARFRGGAYDHTGETGRCCITVCERRAAQKICFERI